MTPSPIVGLATFDYDLKIIDDFGDAESPRNYQYSGDARPTREALGCVIRHRLLVVCNEYAAFARRPGQQVRIGCAAQARLAGGHGVKTGNTRSESAQYVVVEILIDEQSGIRAQSALGGADGSCFDARLFSIRARRSCIFRW
jgi:hypothetical protein